MAGKLLTVCCSPQRGTVKVNVGEGLIKEGWGLEGDAHGGDWDRQISIFPVEAMAKVPADKMAEVSGGGYTENLTIEGIPLAELIPGAIVRIGNAEIKILYVGKDVYKEHDRPYIVSREGRFGKVLKSGTVKVGDKVEVIAAGK